MSISLMNLVWDLDLAASEKIVLLALADQANKDGECWPSVPTLCRRASKSERTVQAMLAGLKRDGHISWTDIVGRGRKYRVHPRRNCAPTPAEFAGPDQPQPPPAPPQNSRDTPAEFAGKPPITKIRDTDVSLIGQRVAEPAEVFEAEPECAPPSPADSEGQDREQPQTAPRPADPDLPGWMPLDAWADFVSHRKSMRKPLTPKAITLAIGKLDDFRTSGMSPATVINQSIANGWTGLFPLKDRPHERDHQHHQREPDDPLQRAVVERRAARAAGQRP